MTDASMRNTGVIWGRHFLILGLLIGVGFAIVAGIQILYGDGAESVYIGNDSIALAPVYNRNGSWLHGRLDIGYHSAMLLAEGIVSLTLLLFSIRFIIYLNSIFQMRNTWLCFTYFFFATAIARIINVLAGQYTLDYLYISVFHATYDLFDFYLGIGLLIALLWCVFAEMKYHRLKKNSTRGMNLWQKLRWELAFTGKALKASCLPRDRWDKL